MKSLIEIIDQCGAEKIQPSWVIDSDAIRGFKAGYWACFQYLAPALKIALLHIEEEAGPNTSAHAKIRALLEAK